MSIIREPKPDPTLAPFNEGIAALKQSGELAGHITTSVEWLPRTEAKRMLAELNIRPEDF